MEPFLIRPIDLRAATPTEYLDLAALKNAMRLEALPEDPPWPPDEQTARFKNMPALKHNTAWVASHRNSGQDRCAGASRYLHDGRQPSCPVGRDRGSSQVPPPGPGTRPCCD